MARARPRGHNHRGMEQRVITIAELIGSLSIYREAQHQLALCRGRATGDVEYFSYGYIQDLKLAEKELEQRLNTYIDQRVAERFERLVTP
jgi:hypothetical protein